MAGAPCPPDLVRRVMEEMGCPEILIAHGQTEASPITHLTRPDDPFEKRTTTVETNLPHQEVKVVDPATGAVVPCGDAGEKADAEELRRCGEGRIAHFKIPRYLRVVTEFPMTVTGKLQKFRLRELMGSGAEPAQDAMPIGYGRGRP